MRIGESFCPGVLHAVPAKDGLLIRIRIPGGLINAPQLRTVASLAHEFADGSVEITSRANLQLRALRPENLDKVAQRITAAGLLPSPQHDRVRNLVASPLAGLDPEEVVDPRPLILLLDQRLRAETIFAELHPKFSFAIHGGPTRFSRDADDLSLEAVGLKATPSFRLSIAGSVLGSLPSMDHGIDAMLEAAKMCISLAKRSGLPVRGRRILAIPGGRERIVDALRDSLTACIEAIALPCFVETPFGVYPSSEAGRVNLIPSVPLGRLTVDQAHFLADETEAWGGVLRLAPWRGVVLGSLPRTAVEELVEGLRVKGLGCDGKDGFRGIAACAGCGGCDASLADVRADAATLARRLLGRPVPVGWTVNLSGCEKQCARRHGATADLVASSSGYLLTLQGQPAGSACSAESAIVAVTGLHSSLLCGAAS